LTDEIKYGQDNDEVQVKRLQKFLNQFENENLDVDGNYDPATIAAVNRYQRKYAHEILQPWGYAQPISTVFTTMRGHINDRMREASNCQRTCEDKFTKYLRLGSQGDEVKKVQEFLKLQGFYNGPIDGYYSQAVKNAVRDFQNEN
jgi:peptidoglycan hydrolase-like protein with peptidoglycan-binding domain